MYLIMELLIAPLGFLSLTDQISLSFDWYMTLPHCNGSLFDSSVTCINRSLNTCGFCPFYMFVQIFNLVCFSFSV